MKGSILRSPHHGEQKAVHAKTCLSCRGPGKDQSSFLLLRTHHELCHPTADRGSGTAGGEGKGEWIHRQVVGFTSYPITFISH